MNELQPVEQHAIAAPGAIALTREQVELVKRTCAKDATDDELNLFLSYCKAKGTNPLAKEIYFSKYNGQVNFLTSYHFLLAKVQETGQFEGMTQALFCGEDGVWKELWTGKELPYACKIGVYRKGYREPVYSIRYMSEVYKGTVSPNKPNQWNNQPLQMLKKCTISDALRLACDDILRGMYIIDEMPTAYPAEPEPQQKPVVIQPLPDISLEGWVFKNIPDWCLPPELQGKGITFERLANDEALKIAALKKDGTPYEGRWLIHRWQTKKDSPEDLKMLASALLEKFPHKEEKE